MQRCRQSLVVEAGIQGGLVAPSVLCRFVLFPVCVSLGTSYLTENPRKVQFEGHVRTTWPILSFIKEPEAQRKNGSLRAEQGSLIHRSGLLLFPQGLSVSSHIVLFLLGHDSS